MRRGCDGQVTLCVAAMRTFGDNVGLLCAAFRREPRLTAAAPAENPCCSCKLTEGAAFSALGSLAGSQQQHNAQTPAMPCVVLQNKKTGLSSLAGLFQAIHREGAVAKVCSHGLQLQSLWIILTAAVS